VAAAFAGSRSAARTRKNAAAGSIELTPAQLEEIDKALVGAGVAFD
jgi:aryl-alcohol dehydrogenase-like predicted oxidoreductase